MSPIPCPIGLVALFLIVTRGNILQTPVYLSTSRPSETFSTKGDVLIGAVTPIHEQLQQPEVKFTEPPEQSQCRGFKARFFLNVLGLLFAVKETEEDPAFLPNITVGLQVYDSCVSGAQALKGTLALLSHQPWPTPNFCCDSQQPLLGVIGGMTSPESQTMAELLSVYRVPQISHGSQHPSFSDRLLFPSFLRMVPSSAHQPRVLAQLLSHFNWTWVGLVGSDTGNFEHLDQQLREELRLKDICMAFSKKTNSRWGSISNTADLVASFPKVTVIVCDCYHLHYRLLAEALQRRDVTGKTWVLSASFAHSPSVLGPQALNLLNGSLGLSIHSGVMPGFEDFLLGLHPDTYPGSSLLKKLWATLHDCSWPGLGASTQNILESSQSCTGLENITAGHLSVFQLKDLKGTYQAYLAAKVFLTAYQQLASCSPGQGPFLGGSCAPAHNFRPWQMLHYTQKAHFITKSQEEIYFTKEGEMLATLDVINIYLSPEQKSQIATVGLFDFRADGKKLLINNSAIIWSGGDLKAPSSICNDKCPVGTWKFSLTKESQCCYQCNPCPRGEMAKIPDSSACERCPGDQWPNREQSGCLHKTIDFLSYHEPLGTALAVCTALLFLLALTILGIFIWHHHTPIVRANNRRLSYVLLSSLALCFLCPFMFIGHPGPFTCALRQVAFGVTFTACISTVLSKTIVVVAAFHATRPDTHIRRWVKPALPTTIPLTCSLLQALLCALWVALCPPQPMNSTEPGPTVTLQCDEGSLGFFYAMLGYLGLLGLISLLVAFPARRLPDTFNEAKHITVSMLVCSCVWVSFIPAHMSARGKDTVAVEVFAILASGAGLLFCLFFPKCYIILLHPERNTRGQMLGRHCLKRGKKQSAADEAFP